MVNGSREEETLIQEELELRMKIIEQKAGETPVDPVAQAVLGNILSRE